MVRDFRTAPWLLAPAAVLVALTVGWVGGILSGFGTPGRHGVHFSFEIFIQSVASQGSVYALALLVALGIAAFGERTTSGQHGRWEWLRAATVLAATVEAAAAIAFAVTEINAPIGSGALLSIVVLQIGLVLTALAVVLPLSAATICWGLILRSRSHRSAGS